MRKKKLIRGYCSRVRFIRLDPQLNDERRLLTRRTSVNIRGKIV